MISIALPYPHKSLWPNGRAHWCAKAVQVKKHRAWADTATLEALRRRLVEFDGFHPIPIHITVHAKSRGPLPDRDGCVSAAKSYLDGVADRLGFNDRFFAAPTVEFAAQRDARFVIEVGVL